MSLFQDEYLTVEEVAKHHRVSTRTVYEWAKDKKISAIKDRGIYWFPKAGALAYVPKRRKR